MRLEYLREYRTLFHIGKNWGVHESTVQRTVKRIEDSLINSQEFSWPGKKELGKQNTEIEGAIIDVSETEIERQKKTEVIL